MNHKITTAAKRKTRIRGHITANLYRPRLIVHRTNQHIYAQVVDHLTGATLTSASDLAIKTKATKSQKATLVGETIAKKAQAQKIKKITFDRGPYKYHGRVKALAEAARSTGLQF